MIRIVLSVIFVLFCLVDAKMHINETYNNVSFLVERRNNLVNEIRVLKAEVEYLGNIDRIELLSNKFLSVGDVSRKTVMLVAGKSQEVVTAVPDNVERPQWRYKNRNNIINVRHTR